MSISTYPGYFSRDLGHWVEGFLTAENKKRQRIEGVTRREGEIRWIDAKLNDIRGMSKRARRHWEHEKRRLEIEIAFMGGERNE